LLQGCCGLIVLWDHLKREGERERERNVTHFLPLVVQIKAPILQWVSRVSEPYQHHQHSDSVLVSGRLLFLYSGFSSKENLSQILDAAVPETNSGLIFTDNTFTNCHRNG